MIPCFSDKVSDHESSSPDDGDSPVQQKKRQRKSRSDRPSTPASPSSDSPEPDVVSRAEPQQSELVRSNGSHRRDSAAASAVQPNRSSSSASETISLSSSSATSQPGGGAHNKRPRFDQGLKIYLRLSDVVIFKK